MKNDTMWLLIAAGVVAYLVLNKQATGLQGIPFRPQPFTPRRLAATPLPRMQPNQGDGFGMDHRARYGYDD